jgi:hypothetical protein
MGIDQPGHDVRVGDDHRRMLMPALGDAQPVLPGTYIRLMKRSMCRCTTAAAPIIKATCIMERQAG